MPGSTIGILGSTKNKIFRNKWLSVATILVTFIVFTTSSVFIGLSLIAQKSVTVFQAKAQLQIYFYLDTPEEEILKVRDKMLEYEGTEQARYISKTEALSLYRVYYSQDPDLLENVSEDWLPASIEVRASSLEELDGLTEIVQVEHETNPFIEDVHYHEDIVKQLKSISRTISVGALIIIGIFSAITISLIFITISFNIRTHKNEIEIMHLVGSSDSYIKVPFILEGSFYTVVGSLLAGLMIIVPWGLFMRYGEGSNLHFLVSDLINELGLNFLYGPDLKFVALFMGVHLLASLIIGVVSSSFAVVKHLDLKEK